MASWFWFHPGQAEPPPVDNVPVKNPCVVADLWDVFARVRAIPQTRCRSNLPPGWVGLMNRLCDKLTQAGWNGRFDQMKEKFGVLCIYLTAQAPGLLRLVEECERASADICLNCGRQGRLAIVGGWHATLCERCEHAVRS